MAKKKNMLGKWHLRKTLGRGGMGAVYLAEHVDLKRKAALKVMAPLRKASTDRVAHEYLERFRREILTLSRFRHPNLPRLYDFDLEGEYPYFAQEFIAGEDLQGFRDCSFVERRRLAMDSLRALAAALAQLHAAGIFHRDVKPANLIRAEDGRILLVDMGLVKLSDVTTLTKEGAAVGTARYMPPELLMGEGYTERSDLYLAGLVALELLDGSHPFLGSDFKEVLALKMTEERLLPGEDLCRKLHPSFVDLIGRLTALDPAERPPTAVALGEVLEKLPADGAPSEGPAQSPLPPKTLRGMPSQRAVPRREAEASHLVEALPEATLHGGERSVAPGFHAEKRLPTKGRMQLPFFVVLLSLLLIAGAASWRWGAAWLRPPGGPAAGDLSGLRVFPGERHVLVRWESKHPYVGAVQVGTGAGSALSSETLPSTRHELRVAAHTGNMRLTLQRHGDEEGLVQVLPFETSSLQIRRVRLHRQEDGTRNLEVESSLPARFLVRYDGTVLGRSLDLLTRATLPLNALSAFAAPASAEVVAEGVDSTCVEKIARERLAPDLALAAVLEGARRLAASRLDGLDARFHDRARFLEDLNAIVLASGLPKALSGLDSVKAELLSDADTAQRLYQTLVPLDEFETMPYFQFGRAKSPLRLRAFLDSIVSLTLSKRYPPSPDLRRPPVRREMAMRFPGKQEEVADSRAWLLVDRAFRIEEIRWTFELSRSKLDRSRRAELCVGGMFMLPWLRLSARVNGSLDIHLTGTSKVPGVGSTTFMLMEELGPVDQVGHMDRLMVEPLTFPNYVSYPTARFPTRYLRAGRNEIVLRPLGNRWASPADGVVHGVTLSLLP